jgi:hypothetical protein
VTVTKLSRIKGMPLVRVRIFLAEKLLSEPTRPFAAMH